MRVIAQVLAERSEPLDRRIGAKGLGSAGAKRHKRLGSHLRGAGERDIRLLDHLRVGNSDVAVVADRARALEVIPEWQRGIGRICNSPNPSNSTILSRR